jgi:hypothetical protein
MSGWGEGVFSLSHVLDFPRLGGGLQVFSPIGAVFGSVLPICGGRIGSVLPEARLSGRTIFSQTTNGAERALLAWQEEGCDG